MSVTISENNAVEEKQEEEESVKADDGERLQLFDIEEDGLEESKSRSMNLTMKKIKARKVRRRLKKPKRMSEEP